MVVLLCGWVDGWVSMQEAFRLAIHRDRTGNMGASVNFTAGLL